jgi:hypothetical protein
MRYATLYWHVEALATESRSRLHGGAELLLDDVERQRRCRGPGHDVPLLLERRVQVRHRRLLSLAHGDKRALAHSMRRT